MLVFMQAQSKREYLANLPSAQLVSRIDIESVFGVTLAV